MDAFTAMRQFIASNAQIFQRLDVMEQNQLAIVAHQTETDHKLEEVFRRLDSGNVQYSPIDIITFDRSHDRFLCIDETIYHLGASIKDLGKKWFAFNRMEMPTTELLQKIQTTYKTPHS